MPKKIPSIVVPRLSLYSRVLFESRGADFISSQDLASLTGLNAAIVRKDLAYFGQFGIPGKGYQVETLQQKILDILGINKKLNVALVGVGNLGSALLSYRGFDRQGFTISCAFDNDLRKIGKNLEGILIQDISELPQAVKEKNIKMAIVAVPASCAQEVINSLIKVGVRAILNFAPLRPKVSAKVVQVLNIDLSIELERLAFFLTSKK